MGAAVAVVVDEVNEEDVVDLTETDEAQNAGQAPEPEVTDPMIAEVMFNNFTVAGENIEWAGGQVEKGGEEGRLHIQLALRFTNPRSPGAVGQLVAGWTKVEWEGGTFQWCTHAHAQPAHNPAKTVAYCQKEETRVLAFRWFEGEETYRRAQAQYRQGGGGRTADDKAAAAEGEQLIMAEVAEGRHMGRMLQEILGSSGPLAKKRAAVRTAGQLMRLAPIMPAQQRIEDDLENRIVILLCGPTGIGKTWWAKREMGKKFNAFLLDGTLGGSSGKIWLDGYVDHGLVVVDEVKAETVAANREFYFNLTDKYNFVAQVKGGVVQVGAALKVVVLTSNDRPEQFEMALNQRCGEAGAAWRRRIEAAGAVISGFAKDGESDDEAKERFKREIGEWTPKVEEALRGQPEEERPQGRRRAREAAVAAEEEVPDVEVVATDEDEESDHPSQASYDD